MAEDIHDALAKTLASIRQRLGAGAFDDRRKVLALLADMLPGHNRLVRLLGIAFDNGAVQAIASARREQAELEIDRHAQRVDADIGIRKAIMVPVLRAVAYAADRGALPSTYPAPQAESEVVGQRAASEESWVGLADPPPPPAPAPAAPPRAAPAPTPPVAVAPPTPAPAPAPVATPPVPPPATPVPRVPGDAPKGLGGWLLAPLAWLVVSATGLIGCGLMTGSQLLDLLFSDESTIIEPGLFILPPLLLALGIVTLVVLLLFVRRSSVTRLAYCLWLVPMAALPVYADGLRLTAIDDDTIELGLLVAIPIAISIAGVVYFLRSRRVRNTFVR
jgi:hypothetical protein